MFARNVFGILKENEGKVAILGIKDLEKFYAEIGMPKNMRKTGVKEEDLERVSPKSHRVWKYWYNGFNK
jgi:alcohol dehydrogenase YqhD (iron-dependent ADH family)